jgi:single-stranded-DNA-specific exonuclease
MSYKKRNWVYPGPSETKINGIDKSVSDILLSRGVTEDKISDFLDPKLRNLMPDPYFFLDMEIAICGIADAIQAGKKIGIFSDYDVDGATSAGIMGRALRLLGHDKFHVRIPDRIQEGYGPNISALTQMAEEHGCDEIMILDSGSLAFEALEKAKEKGFIIYVIDHHETSDALPPARAVINPKRKDQPTGYEDLCAAGMSFLFAAGLAREMERRGWFDERAGRPDTRNRFMELLDLTALGTVADVVSLLHPLNRAFVKQGLKIMNSNPSLGIKALAKAAGVKDNESLDEMSCGWVLGPRINAGGRIAESDLGARLFLTQDTSQADEIAERLEMLNRERRMIDQGATEAALSQFRAWEPGVTRKVAIAIVDTHEGVVGISAGRLKDALDAPAIVLTTAHDGSLKGSARSVPGFDIGHAIMRAHAAGHAIKGGGHAQAGGVTLRKDQLPGFQDFMDAELRQTLYFKEGLKTAADLKFPLKDVTVGLVKSFDILRPFGQMNPKPLIWLQDVTLKNIFILKEKHLKLLLSGPTGSIDALIWNSVGSGLHSFIEDHLGQRVDVLCRAEINVFLGNEKIQVFLEDIRKSG